jgi:hypothetical protein
MRSSAVTTTITRVQIRPRRSVAAGLTPVDPSADFAEWVRGQLEGPVLRYSARLRLIKEAERRGLGRFEANLIIAGALHRVGMEQEYEMRPRGEWLAPVLTFLILQSALIVGAWWALR